MTYKLKQKVACANSIVRAIRTIGAPCFNSSAVTEKSHIGVNHALRLSKGKNKIWNSLKQVTRLGFLRMREVRTADEEAAQIASEEQDRAETAADATRAATRGKSAVMRNFGRGVDDKAKALQGMSPKAIARMCHCIREHMGALCAAARNRLRRRVRRRPDWPFMKPSRRTSKRTRQTYTRSCHGQVIALRTIGVCGHIAHRPAMSYNACMFTDTRQRGRLCRSSTAPTRVPGDPLRREVDFVRQ